MLIWCGRRDIQADPGYRSRHGTPEIHRLERAMGHPLLADLGRHLRIRIHCPNMVQPHGIRHGGHVGTQQ